MTRVKSQMKAHKKLIVILLVTLLIIIPSGVANTASNGGFRVPDVDLSAVLQPAAFSSFTAANGTSLDAITPEVSGAWTEQAGDWDVQGNKATCSATSLATVNSGISDLIIDVIAVVQWDDASNRTSNGVTLRYSGGDYWEVRLDPNTNEIQLLEVNGGITNRASAAVVLTGGTAYDVRGIAYGQTIDAFVDGGSKVSYGSAALNETATAHGMRIGVAGSPASQGTMDNFAIYPRTSSVYDAVLGAY